LQGQVQLVLAGRLHPDYDPTNLRDLVAQQKQTVLLEGFQSDQAFADFHAVSDVILLPYLRITGSSALLAALGFGRGVIVSDLPFFKEILEPEPEAGMLFKSGDRDSFLAAIKAYLQVPSGRRSEAALRLSKHYSWDRCIEPVAAIVKQWKASRLGLALSN